MRVLLAAIVAAAGALSAFKTPVVRAAEAAIINVHFKLTDLQYRPLPGAPVRLVLGSTSGWQKPDAGQRFVTDEGGEYQFKTAALLDKRTRKVPVDFVSTRTLSADHLMVAAELEYMTFHWLYTIDVYHFPDDTNALLDNMVVYTPDGRGNFTRKAQRIGGSWKMADLGGRILTGPGYDPWDFALRPDSPDPTNRSAKTWTLQLAFRKSPEPVGR